MLDQEMRSLITAARVLGGSSRPVYLSDDELLRLCSIVAYDLRQPLLVSDTSKEEELRGGYYSIPLAWFKEPVAGVSFEQRFLQLKDAISDFPTYFKNLCAVHKRRIKFERILEHQPLPQMDQIVLRCLLEYGMKPSETLASWLVWRKWLYDIDNRSAQETAYLFEPILTAALGGVQYSAKTSPVKRTDNPGAKDGRQVDCLVGKLAYEFKMRVTIAASGQGRFGEELSYARDCQTSGFVPVLLVLDPTPSSRLDELIAEYAKYRGSAYVGDAAWQHLEQEAGPVMGIFVEKYVRSPLREVDASYASLQPIALVHTNTSIQVQLGADSFEIARSPSEPEEEDGEDTSHAYE